MKANKLLFGFFIIPFLLLTGCQKNDASATISNREMIVYADGSQVPSNSPTIEGSLKNAQEISILPEAWMDYYNDLDDYLNVDKYYEPGVENTKPISNTLSWTLVSDASYYMVSLSTSIKMTNSITIFSLEKSVELKDLFAGKHYYYQIYAYYAEKTAISRRFDFTTVDFFRTLDIDGVQNARDIGNKLTADGAKRIKQGLVYRTARLDEATAKGKIQAKEQYGIKTDLDLREAGPTSSPLGADVNYINNASGQDGSPYYTGGAGVQVAAYQPAMVANLQVFADANNLPAVFHCAVGRDRTGTLAITLYLLLGINLEQIKQDFIVYAFTSICNSAAPRDFCVNMENLLNYYRNYVGHDGVNSGTIYERTVEYCTDIGLSNSEITAIIVNLLEDVVNE